MSKVISGISMSLDGFVTGPNVTRDQQLGDGGQILHQWLHDPDRVCDCTELLARRCGEPRGLLSIPGDGPTRLRYEAWPRATAGVGVTAVPPAARPPCFFGSLASHRRPGRFGRRSLSSPLFIVTDGHPHPLLAPGSKQAKAAPRAGG